MSPRERASILGSDVDGRCLQQSAASLDLVLFVFTHASLVLSQLLSENDARQREDTEHNLVLVHF